MNSEECKLVRVMAEAWVFRGDASAGAMLKDWLMDKFPDWGVRGDCEAYCRRHGSRVFGDGSLVVMPLEKNQLVIVYKSGEASLVSWREENNAKHLCRMLVEEFGNWGILP